MHEQITNSFVFFLKLASFSRRQQNTLDTQRQHAAFNCCPAFVGKQNHCFTIKHVRLLFWGLKTNGGDRCIFETNSKIEIQSKAPIEMLQSAIAHDWLDWRPFMNGDACGNTENSFSDTVVLVVSGQGARKFKFFVLRIYWSSILWSVVLLTTSSLRIIWGRAFGRSNVIKYGW